MTGVEVADAVMRLNLVDREALAVVAGERGGVGRVGAVWGALGAFAEHVSVSDERRLMVEAVEGVMYPRSVALEAMAVAATGVLDAVDRLGPRERRALEVGLVHHRRGVYRDVWMALAARAAGVA